MVRDDGPWPENRTSLPDCCRSLSPTSRSVSSFSYRICSSKIEGSTTAAAPASSSRRILSMSRVSGDADAISGFFRGRPRYVVGRSIFPLLRPLGSASRRARLAKPSRAFWSPRKLSRYAVAFPALRCWSGGRDHPAALFMSNLPLMTPLSCCKARSNGLLGRMPVPEKNEYLFILGSHLIFGLGSRTPWTLLRVVEGVGIAGADHPPAAAHGRTGRARARGSW